MKTKNKIATCFITMLIISFVLILSLKCCKEPPNGTDGLSLGIYSETPDFLVPDKDTFFGTYSGGGALIDEFTDDTNDKIEGGISKKTTWSVNASQNQYAGWFIQNGLSGTPDSESRDMSDFRGGKLTFWVKSSINLGIGIRSGNVTQGTETSKVMLNNYSPFKPDNQWYKIEISLSVFTGEAPKADLSQIKILFNVFSNTPTGGTGGDQKTFWIDDVRWEN